MPAYVEELDKVDVSYTDWFVPSHAATRIVVKVIEICRLAKVERKGESLRVGNLTVINYLIWKIGKPVNEGKLTYVLLSWQIVWIMIAFLLRYKGAGLVYSIVD
jgi:hypothetical protein